MLWACGEPQEATTPPAGPVAPAETPPSTSPANPPEEPPSDDPLHLGTRQTFEMGTWNIRNFPKDESCVPRVAALLRRMNLDVIALQEIAQEKAFGDLLAELPGYAGLLSDHVYATGEYQKLGLIYRQDQVRVLGFELLFRTESYVFPRPPLQVSLEVTRSDGTPWSLTVIVVHLKATGGLENTDRRRRACDRLKGYVDELLRLTPEQDVVVLGDFNDDLADAPRDNVFQGFLDAPERYRFATQALVQQNEYSYIPSHLLPDHILLTSTVLPDLQDIRTKAVSVEKIVKDYSFLSEISDHRPVVTIGSF